MIHSIRKWAVALCVFGATACAADSPAAMWIWTDKVVYQPGQALTLRVTLRRNGDMSEYKPVAYMQNNQTGVRTEMPEIFGFEDMEKHQLLGEGLTAPTELGMHTIVLQARPAEGGKAVKTAYAKFSVVDGVEEIQGNIDESRTLVNTKSYLLKGVVYVRNNAVLTIEPGTVIQGEPGSQPPSVLVVTRTGRLEAKGTRSRPILMTSSQPVGQRKRGDWGGLILLGSARGNVPADRQFVEGLPQNDETRYGGEDDESSCGTLRYMRVEFAGAELSPNNEVNGITFAGCGRGTVAEYLQSSYGFDDAFEWFGGAADAKYLVASYPGDDHIDTQLGYRGRIQHVLIVQNADRGNRGIEADNSEFNFTAEPKGASAMWNFTIIGSALPGLDESNAPGIFLRRGAVGTYNNMIVTNFASKGVELSGGQDPTLTNLTNNEGTTMNGILLWNNGQGSNPAAENTVSAQIHSGLATYAEGADKNFVAADPMLRRPHTLSDPDFRPMPESPAFGPNWIQPPDDGFFDQWATWIGAFGDYDWTEEWSSFLDENDLSVQ